jgi:sporulation protein YqfC
MRGKDIMDRVTDAASRTGEPLLKQPLLELCGEHRVLIEHHKGIGAYSPKEIHVKVRFGEICIGGMDLEICRMTAEQLVITGRIETVTLLKGSGE